MTPKITKGFVILASLYPFLLITSNVMAPKVIAPLGITLNSAILVFPLIYIASDLMTEVYGAKLSMFVIRMCTLIGLFFALFTQILIWLPYPEYWDGQEAYVRVFSGTPRVFLASSLAYFIGDWLNTVSLSIMKVRVKVGGFPLRSIVSSAIGQAFDSIIFLTIVFHDVMPLSTLMQLLVFQYLAKVGYEIVFMPLTVFIVKKWKKWDCMDHYDTGDFISLYRPI